MASTTISTRGFRAFYRAHYGFVWAAVRRLGVPPALVDDAAQDTFVVAYRRRGEFRAPSARPWLYGIARGVASNYRRTAHRVDRKRRAIAHASVATTRTREPVLALHDLERFLCSLPTRDRELFVLSEVEGFTGPELADALGCNTRAAYRRVSTLRKRFVELGGDDETISRDKAERPRATAQGWAALVPALQTVPIGIGLPTAAATTTGGGGIGTAIGLGSVVAAAAIAGVIVASPPSSPRVEPATHTLAGPSASDPPGPTEADHAPVAAGSVASAADPVAAEPTTNAAVVSPSPTPRPTPPRARPEPPRVAPTPTAEPRVDTLAEENALLSQATRALARDDPDAALTALRSHATRFGDSALADLRTALRVEALCALGKGAQARGEAHAWVSAHPDSPSRKKILEACPVQTRAAGQPDH